jgi:hypothetical protein
VLVEVDRTYRASQVRRDNRGGVFGYRGGTATLVEATVRLALFGPERIGPYALAGFAAGTSRSQVSALFPDRVTNRVRAIAVGGGLHLPLGHRLSLFGEGRIIVGEEAQELFAVAPIRAGVAWRFGPG